MKTYTQTKNKFVLSIMFMAFVLFAVSGIFLLRHNNMSVQAEEQPKWYTTGNEETKLGNDTDGHVIYSWSILDAENKTAKLYKVTMDGQSQPVELVIPKTIQLGDGDEYTFTEMYSSSTNNQNGVFYPSRDKIKSIKFASDTQMTNIGANAFYGCTALESVTIPSSIKNIGINAFGGCDNLITITYYADVTSTFTLGNGIFNGSGGDLNINIMEGVTTIPAYAFSGMNNINRVTFDKDAQVTTIGEGAFMNSNLTDITIPSTVTSIGEYAFAGNPNINLQIAQGNENFAVSNSCLYKLTDGKKTTLWSVPSDIESVTLDAECTEINANVFYACTKLTTIVGNENFAFENNCLYKLVEGKKQILAYVTANATEFTPHAECTEYAPNAFINAKSLTKLTITSNIENNAYEGVTTITEVVIQEGVTTIGVQAFWKCSNLTTVTIPSTITTIGEGAFDSCVNLTTVNYNATNATIVASEVAVSDVFNDAGTNGDGFTFNVGANVTHIPAGLFTTYSTDYSPKLIKVNFAEGSVLTTIGDDAFYMVNSLTEINFPDTLTTIGEQSFEGAGITSAIFSANITSIGNKAFYTCADLKNVEFTYTEGSANITIGESAFQETGIQELILSNKVTSIGANAFNKCSNLVKVTFTNTSMSDPQVTIGNGAFLENNAEVKYYYYDHDFVLANTIFTNTTNNHIYVVKLFIGDNIYKTYNAPVDDVITLPTNDEIDASIRPAGSGLVGWSTDKDADLGDATYTVIAEDENNKNELYAIWQDRFTLTLSLEDGTDATLTEEATYEVAVPTITPPTRNGYTFAGFYTKKDGVGTKYYNSDGTSNRNWDIYADTTLYAFWTINNYKITFASGAGYTIEVSGKDDFTSGSEITINDTLVFTMTIATGYKNAQLIAEGAEGTYTFTTTQEGQVITGTLSGVYSDIVIKSSVEAIEYDITLDIPAEANYSIKAVVNGTDEYTTNFKATIEDEIVFTVVPNTGYNAGTINVNGTIGAFNYDSDTRTLSDVNCAMTISATDATVANYIITFESGENYTITAQKDTYDGPVSFISGSTITYFETLTFTVNVNSGYEALALSITGDGEYTFESGVLSNVTSALNISGGVKLAEYTVTFASSDNMTITATKNGSEDFVSGSTITMEDTVEFTVTPSTGYKVATLTPNITEGFTFENNVLSNLIDNIEFTYTTSPIEYAVAFNENAGNDAVETQNFTYGTAQNLTANTFTRTGYTFAGWAKSSDGEVEYIDAQEVSNLTTTDGDTVMLYAIWIPITYTVKFNENTGTGTVATTTQNFTYDIAQNLTANSFTRTGYTFAGWAESTDGEVVYSNAQEVSNLTAEAGATIELFAVFSPITYTIKYNKYAEADVVNNIEGTMTDTIATYDQDFTLADCAYTLAGYTFLGWATEQNSTIVYENLAEITENLADDQDVVINLYTVWEKNSYTITYANGIGYTIEVICNTNPVISGETKFDIDTTVEITLTVLAGYHFKSNYEGTEITQSIAIEASDKGLLTLQEINDNTHKFTLTNIADNLAIKVAVEPNENTKYTVEHYLQKVETTEGAGDANYDIVTDDTEEKYGTTGESTNATTNTYTGFELAPFTQTTIAGDGSTVVKLYYNRIIYTITFEVDETKCTVTGDLVQRLPYGATVIVPTIETEHYTFEGWNISETVVNDATYTAEFTPKIYDIDLFINDSNAGYIAGGHTNIPNVPYGTKIVANGNVLTIQIEGDPITIQGVPTPTSVDSVVQYRLVNWYYNGNTPITMNGVYLDSANAAITAHFEKRLIYVTDTDGNLDLSEFNGVAENSDAKIEKLDNANENLVVPAGKRAMQAYNINLYEKDGNTLTNNVVPTAGNIKITLNVSEEIRLATGWQVLIFDEANRTVHTCDATITNGKLTFTAPCLGQMLIIADVNATFPWWIIVITIVVISIVFAILYWYFVIRPREKIENESDNAEEDYDSVLTGLAEEKRTEDTNVVEENTPKGKKVTKTTTTTTKKTTQKSDEKKNK